jgi:hypothetical protein
MTKVCNSCKLTKPLDLYYKCNKHKDGVQYDCKECQSTRYFKNKEHNLDYATKHNLRQYGLSLEDYNNMLISQKSVCAICERPSNYLKLNVDHCHKTGKVRGLLCQKCNSALGLFQDDKDLCIKAAKYLDDTKD